MPRSGIGGCLGRAFVACCFLAGSAAAAHAGRYEDAVSAYDAGKYRAAYELLLPLAEAGDCRAQFALGVIIDDFRIQPYGRPRPSQADRAWAEHALGDDAEDLDNAAFGWLLRAAEQGHANAQFRVADKYRSMSTFDIIVLPDGEGAAPDPRDYELPKEVAAELRDYEAKARAWYERAADSGNVVAMFEMSIRAEGRHDQVEALKWAILSEERGFGPAEIYPNILRRWMKPDDVLEAERRAEAWRAVHANDPPWGPC